MGYFIAHVLMLRYSSRYAPGGRYLHHSPLFEEAHAFHFPAYGQTLESYKEVYRQKILSVAQLNFICLDFWLDPSSSCVGDLRREWRLWR